MPYRLRTVGCEHGGMQPGRWMYRQAHGAIISQASVAEPARGCVVRCYVIRARLLPYPPAVASSSSISSIQASSCCAGSGVNSASSCGGRGSSSSRSSSKTVC